MMICYVEKEISVEHARDMVIVRPEGCKSLLLTAAEAEKIANLLDVDDDGEGEGWAVVSKEKGTWIYCDAWTIFVEDEHTDTLAFDLRGRRRRWHRSTE